MISRTERPRAGGALLARVAEARRQSDALFGHLKSEAIFDRPIPERHRFVFYVGHLEAFDWNLIGRYGLDLPAFDATLDRLFAFGIDPVDGDLPDDRPEDWPRVPEVHAYRDRVRNTVDDHLGSVLRSSRPPTAFEGDTLIHVMIEHRLMHVETLAYMLNQMPHDRLQGEAIIPEPAEPPAGPRRVEIPEGRATLGIPRRGAGSFGWDNEFTVHSVRVPAFAIDVHNVTNGQYLGFMRSGGYEDRSLWSGDDWDWKEREGIRHPRFWIQEGDAWMYRTPFAEIPLPPSWPAYVSHAEASAYARWAGCTLPTEAQWHRAACGTREGRERAYPWGDEPPADRHGNFGLRRWTPVSVGSSPAGVSAFGVADLVGNGWEWTSTLFAPFDGFERFPFYPGYSADFFDGKHYVMKGGSARTASCLLRTSFRNWFQPRYQNVYAAFRCVAA